MKYWFINQMQSLPKDGDLDNFVICVHWSRMAKETINEKEYQAMVYGTQSFSKDDVANFIPYEDVTYEEVCGWLEQVLSVDDMKASLEANIYNQQHPTEITLPLPWDNPIV